MKRKVLAIALSLALLSSLFVFAAPVSAAGQGGGPENASDNSPHFYFEIPMTYTGNDTTDLYREWKGKPLDVEDVYGEVRELPGTVLHHGDATYFYNIDGTFGPGTASLLMYITDNFKSGIRVCQFYFTLDFDDEYVGTIHLKAQRNLEFVSWRTPAPSCPWRAYWDGIHAQLVSMDCTGDFENFHAQMSFWYEEIGAGALFGTGHFAP